MKRIVAVLLIVTLLAAIAPMALAVPQEGVLTENGGFEENFYRGQPKTWDFTPTETGAYLLFTPGSGSLIGQIVGQTPTDGYDVQSGQHIQVYTLNAGTTYQVQIEMNPAMEGDFVKDVFNIDRQRPLERVTINVDTMSGQRGDYNSVYVEVEPYYYPLTGLKWASSDESILAIDTTEGAGCSFWMKKVGTAKLTATLNGKSASCTVTVEKATGYWDEYEVWPAGQEKKQIALPANQGTSYSYTPSQSGTYALHTEGDIHIDIHSTMGGLAMNQRKAVTMFGDYELVDLIAGETYVIGIANSIMDGKPASGTAYIEKAKDPADIVFYGHNMTDVTSINGYVGGSKNMMAVSDPVYSYALHGNFTFQSTNSEIARLEYKTSEGSNEVYLEVSGQCQIRVTTGGVTKIIPVNVKPSPVLKAGYTSTLKFDATDAYGVTCLFTPEKTANYTFTVKGTGGTCYVKDTGIGNFVENGGGSFGGRLEAGKTYEVILYVGESDHTITVSGGGSPQSTTVATTKPTTKPAATTVATTNVTTTKPSQSATTVAPTTQPSSVTSTVSSVAPTVTTTVPTSQPNTELEKLADAMGGSVENGNVLIVSGDTRVELSANQLLTLAQKQAGLVIAASDYRVHLDHKALLAVTQTGAQTVTLQVQAVEKSDLAQAQKDALQKKMAALIIAVELTSGQLQHHDFAGGTASVTVPFTPEKDKDYAVYYLADNGALEKVASSCADGKLTFTTGHFSEYVVLEETNSSVSDVGGADGPQKVSVAAKLLPWALVSVLAVAGAVTAVIVVKKKKK